VGTSGHGRHATIAGQTAYTATTSNGEAAWHPVRIPPDGCRGPAALANEAGVTEDGPHPAAEVVPSPPGPSHVHPHRPCPGRALSIGRQRSFTDNRGRCVFPPSCRIAPYGAVRGSFPSSRCSRARTNPTAPGQPTGPFADGPGTQVASATGRAHPDQPSGKRGGPAIRSSAYTEMTYEKDRSDGGSVFREVDG
jgi:hypothetical protein